MGPTSPHEIHLIPETDLTAEASGPETRATGTDAQPGYAARSGESRPKASADPSSTVPVPTTDSLKPASPAAPPVNL